MHAACAIGAIAALAATAAGAEPDVSVNVGMFLNQPGRGVAYWGPYGEFVGHSRVAGTHTRYQVGIDVGGLLSSLDLGGFTGVSVTDAGRNSYGWLSSGVDIDLMAIDGLSEDIGTSFAYEGPNLVHRHEPAARLAQRVARLDSVTGDQDAWDRTHVSLGKLGRLDMLLSEPQRILDHGAPGPMLFLSEAGAPEFFTVRILAVVPAPGSFALLALAGLIARPRRRR